MHVAANISVCKDIRLRCDAAPQEDGVTFRELFDMKFEKNMSPVCVQKKKLF